MTDHISLHDLQRNLYRAAERQGADVVNIYGNADELRLAAWQLSRIAERECNGVERWNAEHRMMLAEWNAADQTRADRLTEKNKARVIAALVGCFGPEWSRFFTLEFQGDPRGAPVYLHSATDGARHLVAVY